MSEKKDLKVAPEAKALPDEALEKVSGGDSTLLSGFNKVPWDEDRTLDSHKDSHNKEWFYTDTEIKDL